MPGLATVSVLVVPVNRVDLNALRRTLQRIWKLTRLLGRREFRRGLRFGVAASLENRPALNGLRVATVIDVGANVGQFSLLMTALQPDATIHAFEPLSSSASVLTRLFTGNPRVQVHRCAVGADNGEAILHISRRSDNSSLLPIGTEQVLFAPGTDAVATIPVPVRTLDSTIAAETLQGPVLLKLDVQGGELAALEGAERLLAVIEHVYVEVSFVPLYDGQPLAAAVVGHLQARGFVLAGIGGCSYGRGGRIIQADLLLSRPFPVTRPGP